MFSLQYLLPAIAAARLAAAAACSGTTTIQNSGDASALASCQTYSGTIAIATQAADEIRLDTLQGIDGDLTVVNANNLGSISADSLNTITGSFKLSGVRQLTNLDFPELTEVGSLDWKTLPNLNGLSFSSGLSKVDSISISDTQIQDLSGFTMQEIDDLVLVNNIILTNVSFDLEKIKNQFTVAANGQDMSLSLGSLTTGGEMILQGLGSLDVPELEKVTGALDLESGTFESFEAPKLEEVGSTLTIKKNSQLSEVKMPKLTTVSGGFVIGSCPELSAIDGFPNLETINGNLDFTGDFNDVELSKTISVKGAFNMQSRSNIDDVCNDFENQAGRNLPIRGKFTCSSQVDKVTTIGGGGGSSSGGDSSDEPDAGSLLNIPSGFVIGFTGILAAIFGLF